MFILRKEGWVRTNNKEEPFIVMSDNKCYVINTNNSIISAQLSCKVDLINETLIDNHNNNQKVSFDCLGRLFLGWNMVIC